MSDDRVIAVPSRIDKSNFRRSFHRFRQNSLSVVGLIMILVVVMIAIFAPFIAPYPEDRGHKLNLKERFLPPDGKHLCGTDEAGRDVLSRVIYGSRISLLTGLIPLVMIVIVGVSLGLAAGYLGGIPEILIVRVCDMFLTIPTIALALAMSAAFTPSLFTSMIAIAFSRWPWYTRLTYAVTLSVKEEDFVKVSESLGTSRIRIMLTDILPNISSPLIVRISLDIGFLILLASSLGFFGLGAQPPAPEWGVLVAEGRTHLPAKWWLSLFPGIAIFIAVFGFNLLGDGLRDFFDVEEGAF